MNFSSMKQSEIMLFWDHIQFYKKNIQSERSVLKLHIVTQLERRRGQNLVIISQYRIKLYCHVIRWCYHTFVSKAHTIEPSGSLSTFQKFLNHKGFVSLSFSFFYCKIANKNISWEICNHSVFRTGIMLHL